MMASVFVCMVTTVIISDTVKYYDHFGFTDKKSAIGLGVGTVAVLYVQFHIGADNRSHLAITIAQVSPPLIRSTP